MSKKSYMIFLQMAMDCIYDTAKALKNACIGLCWFCADQISWIRIHPQHVSKIVIFYMYIRLNLLDIYKFLFLFFYKKTGLTSTTFSKEEFIPRIEKIKWRCAQTSHAASNLLVPQINWKYTKASCIYPGFKYLMQKEK